MAYTQDLIIKLNVNAHATWETLEIWLNSLLFFTTKDETVIVPNMMPSESLEEDSDGSHQYPHIMYRPYCTHIHTDKVVSSVNQSRGKEDTALGLGYAQSGCPKSGPEQWTGQVNRWLLPLRLWTCLFLETIFLSFFRFRHRPNPLPTHNIDQKKHQRC